MRVAAIDASGAARPDGPDAPAICCIVFDLVIVGTPRPYHAPRSHYRYHNPE